MKYIIATWKINDIVHLKHWYLLDSQEGPRWYEKDKINSKINVEIKEYINYETAKLEISKLFNYI